MMLFDFKCPDGHITEHLVTSDTTEVRCTECEKTASRMITGTTTVLDAISGDFPGATIAWARKHEKAAKNSTP